MRFLKVIIGWDALWKLIFRKPPDYTRIRFATPFRAAKDIGKREIVFIGEKSNPKWAIILCPCGCGDAIHIDLMSSHTPSMDLPIREGQDDFIQPVVVGGRLEMRKPLLD